MEREEEMFFDPVEEADIPDLLLTFRLVLGGRVPPTEAGRQVHGLFRDNFKGFMAEMRSQEKEYREMKRSRVESGVAEGDEGVERAIQVAREWLEKNGGKA